MEPEGDKPPEQTNQPNAESTSDMARFQKLPRDMSKVARAQSAPAQAVNSNITEADSVESAQTQTPEIVADTSAEPNESPQPVTNKGGIFNRVAGIFGRGKKTEEVPAQVSDANPELNTGVVAFNVKDLEQQGESAIKPVEEQNINTGLTEKPDVSSSSADTQISSANTTQKFEPPTQD